MRKSVARLLDRISWLADVKADVALTLPLSNVYPQGERVQLIKGDFGSWGLQYQFMRAATVD